VLKDATGPGVVRKPDWETQPSGEDMASFYPAVAQFLSVEGRVFISCTVATSGILRTCQAVDEQPKGLGFGEAALGMTGLFRMRPMSIDGDPVAGATVRIPINFKLPDKSPTPPAPKPLPASEQGLALGRRIAIAILNAPDSEVMLERLYTQKLDLVTGADTETQRAIEAAVKAGIEAMRSDIIDVQARSFANQLTIEEMTAIATFVESPAGKALAKASKATASSGWRSYAVAMANAQIVAHDTFCKKVNCTIDKLEAVETPAPKIAGPRKK
jgi:TonB family protein